MKVQKVPGTLPYSALCAPYLRRSFEYLCSVHPVVNGGLFFSDYKMEKALCQGKALFESGSPKNSVDAFFLMNKDSLLTETFENPNQLPAADAERGGGFRNTSESLPGLCVPERCHYLLHQRPVRGIAGGTCQLSGERGTDITQKAINNKVIPRRKRGICA